MYTKAEDRDGNKYLVSWIFEDNGEEGYDDYDYSEPYEGVLID